MASLSAEAHLARIQSQALKLLLRGNLARSRDRLGKAKAEADRARARRDEPLLDRTLVPVS